jgi:hypothetical protein
VDGHDSLKWVGRVGILLVLVAVVVEVVRRHDGLAPPGDIGSGEPVPATALSDLTPEIPPPFEAWRAEGHEDLPHPHPLTRERIRIQHENELIGAMNDAMDLEDGARLREILTTYRERYPEDPSQLQEGYALIADCLEHPGSDSKAAGQRYFDEQRGSILRLFAARHCLGRGLSSRGPR